MGKGCAALFVNLTKAFDTVNHAVLLQRLIDIGFNFIYPTCFQDYLSHRQQCVTLGSNCSAFLPSTKRMPHSANFNVCTWRSLFCDLKLILNCDKTKYTR